MKKLGFISLIFMLAMDYSLVLMLNKTQIQAKIANLKLLPLTLLLPILQKILLEIK